MNPFRKARTRVARAFDRRIERILAETEQRRTIPCGGHEVLARTANGRPIYLDMRDTSVAAHVALGSPWEPHVAAALAAVARPDDTFFDVGANFGYHTLLLTDRLTGPRAFRLFEPNPVVRATLRRTLLVNGLGDRAVLEPVALSDRIGEATLTVRSDLWGGATLTDDAVVEESGRPWIGLSEVEATVTVATTTVDRYCDEHDLAGVDLMKIDVEGHEDAVVAGMTGVLDRSPNARIVLEFTFGAYADPEGFWARLCDAFPHRRAITEDGRLPEVRTLGDLQASTPHELVNVLLTRTPPPN